MRPLSVIHQPACAAALGTRGFEKVNLDRELHAVRDGEISFGAMVSRTKGKWEGIARVVRRRWDVPAWLTVEDLMQSMLEVAWSRLWKWKPGGGLTLEQYLVMQCIDRAKKEIHRARLGRRQHRDDSHTPSQYEQLNEGPEEAQWPRLRIEAEQEEIAEIRKRFERAIARAPNEIDAVACAALACSAGDLAEASVLIYDDLDARLICRLYSEEDATTVVRKAARRVMTSVFLVGG